MSEQNRKRRQEIRSLERRKAEVMAGVVTDDDPLTISVRGGAPVPATAVGASPAVDDAVLVVASGSRYFVLGARLLPSVPVANPLNGVGPLDVAIEPGALGLVDPAPERRETHRRHRTRVTHGSIHPPPSTLLPS